MPICRVRRKFSKHFERSVHFAGRHGDSPGFDNQKLTPPLQARRPNDCDSRFFSQTCSRARTIFCQAANRSRDSGIWGRSSSNPKCDASRRRTTAGSSRKSFRNRISSRTGSLTSICSSSVANCAAPVFTLPLAWPWMSSGVSAGPSDPQPAPDLSL